MFWGRLFKALCYAPYMEMTCVRESNRFLVYDHVLAEQAQRQLWTFCQMAEYRSVHHSGWEKVWRIEDGNVLQGPSFEFQRDAKEKMCETSRIEGVPGALSDLMEVVFAQALKNEQLVGRYGDTWRRLSAKLYLYPMGTGLSWHGDSSVYSGAFTYYTHPEWNIDWGGELFVSETMSAEVRRHEQKVALLDGSDENTNGLELVSVDPALNNHAQNTVLSEAGCGDYIFPKSNRLVLVRGGVLHKINPVSVAAGNHVRSSISGFFKMES